MSRYHRQEGTVVSNQKPIVGLGRPVAIGNHVSDDISVTRHPGQLKKNSLVKYIVILLNHTLKE